MNILFLSQLLPYPPDAGAKVRSYYTLRWLAEKHRVTLVAFTRPDDPPEAIDHLRGFCQAVYCVPIERTMGRDFRSLASSLLRGRSFIIYRDRSTAMDILLKRLLQEDHFDAAHADQLWMAQFAIKVKGEARGERGEGARMVLDEHNACYQIFERLAKGEDSQIKRWLWRREAEKLKRYEATVCRRFDRVVTVTAEDRQILEGLSQAQGSTQAAFSTIPICVDASRVATVTPEGDALNVLHLGTMYWPPNIEGVEWFLREAWPQVRGELPEATFTIVGKNPPNRLAGLAEDGNVELTGYLADPLPALQQAKVFIVPLLSGGGMRVKIIEAWRWGLPVVSTAIGAEGIDYRNGENILIADSETDFAAAVVRVLRDAELNQRLRVNGRRWVEERYDYRVVYPAWDEIYKGIG